MKEMKALILAAHLPRDELTAIAGMAAPHAVRIGNQPLVSFAVDAAHGAGIDDVAIMVCRESCPHVQAVLRDAGCPEPVWIETPRPLGFVESIAAAHDFLGSSPFLVHSGDAVLLQPLGPLVGDLIAGHADALLLRCDQQARDRRHMHLAADTSDLPILDDALAGAHLFGPGVMEMALALGERSQPTSAAAFAAALSRAGRRVETRLVKGSWTYTGTVDDVLEANRMVLDELRGDIPGPSSDVVRIDGRVSLHPSVYLERTTIRGPVVIGRGAVLRDAFVGPYTAIGNDVTIEGAEIEHSIVLAGATIRRPGRRLESSLIGEEATVAGGFAFSSSLRVRVGERTEVQFA